MLTHWSHLCHKLGLSQRQIERGEGVRSQRDLHLLPSVAQLAFHRRNLKDRSQASFGFRKFLHIVVLLSFRTKHIPISLIYDHQYTDLVWVTERVLIHNVARCENSGGWSQRVDTGLKSTCGDREANSVRPKVYNLHRSFLRSLQFVILYAQTRIFESNTHKLGWTWQILLAFTLRKLFSESCQVIADAASEPE